MYARYFPLTLIIFFLFILQGCEEVEDSPTSITFDLSITQQEFMGFGAQIWGYNSNPSVDLGTILKGLNIRYVRITRESATWDQLAATRQVTNALGIQWVTMIWSAPQQFEDEQAMLRDVNGFADWWVSEVAEFDSHNMRPHFIELMNEPDSDGNWSTGIDPPTYNTLVKAVRQGLDERGFVDVEIVGPGLTHLDWSNHSGRWIDALDEEAVQALAVWSTHSWDDGDLCRGGAGCIERQWPSFEGAVMAQDPAKPIFLTEYATKENTFHGMTYPHPDRYMDSGGNEGFEVFYYSATFTHSYAVRVFENTLAHLNNGVNVPFIWQLVDEPTEVAYMKKSWGLVDLDGNPKPVYQALQTLLLTIPVGAKVIGPPMQTDHSLYAGGFIYQDSVIIAIANDDDQAHDATVYLTQLGRKLRIIESVAYRLAQRGDPGNGEADTGQVYTLNITLAEGITAGECSFSVSLPAESTITVVLAAGP